MPSSVTRAVGRVPEPGREPGDGGLARAGRADERDGLAGRDDEVEVVQHRALAVREPHAVEADLAVRGGERSRDAGSGTLGASSSTPDSFSSAAAAAWNRL